MRKEALDHIRLIMRRRDKPEEYWLIPIPTGRETILQCIDLHRAWDAPDMPMFDKTKHTLHTIILKNGTVKDGKKFEDVYKDTGGEDVTRTDVPGFNE